MDNKVPVIISLPLENNKYFEILNEGQALALRSGFVTLAPGADVGSHNTEDFEELVIIVEGEGELETDSGRFKIARGQVAFNPAHTQHNLINTGNEDLKYIYVVARTK